MLNAGAFTLTPGQTATIGWTEGSPPSFVMFGN
jgi:hypothetical protein